MTMGPKQIEWLEGRKLDLETAVAMGTVGVGPNIGFQYHDLEGNPTFIKVRGPDKRMWCVPGGDQALLWQEHTLLEDPGDNPLIITEGEPDAIAVRQSGYAFVTSLPSGAADPSKVRDGGNPNISKVQRVLYPSGDVTKGLKPHIAHFRRVILLSDCDEAGISMRNALVEALEADFAWLPKYPPGCKDANDVLDKFGEEGVRDLVDSARPASNKAAIGWLSDIQNTKPLRPMNCGIPMLSPHFKPVRPSFIVVGGYAKSGKSTVLQALLFNLAHHNPELKFGVYHAEGDMHVPVARARSFYTGMHNPTHVTDDFKQQRDQWIETTFKRIRPNQDELPTFEWFMATAQWQALNQGVNVFVIDPWNQILARAPKGQNKTDYIGECIVTMKRFSERHNAIFILSHHARMPSDIKEKPGPYSLADSAHWFNAADHMILVWRKKAGDNSCRIEIAASKNEASMGVPGFVWGRCAGSADAAFFNLYPARDPDAPVDTLETGQ